MSNTQNLELIISQRSPFARRVRVLMQELGVVFSQSQIDVFAPPAWFLAMNPMGRVPILKTETGESIAESHEIQAYLRLVHGNHPIFQTHGASLVKVLGLSGRATGIMDYSVSYFLEGLRPPSVRNDDGRDEYRQGILKTLQSLENEIRGRSFFLTHFSVADIDVGSALGYCDLRLGKEVVDQFPELRRYWTALSKRPSFEATVPLP